MPLPSSAAHCGCVRRVGALRSCIATWSWVNQGGAEGGGRGDDVASQVGSGDGLASAQVGSGDGLSSSNFGSGDGLGETPAHGQKRRYQGWKVEHEKDDDEDW